MQGGGGTSPLQFEAGHLAAGRDLLGRGSGHGGTATSAPAGRDGGVAVVEHLAADAMAGDIHDPPFDAVGVPRRFTIWQVGSHTAA